MLFFFVSHLTIPFSLSPCSLPFLRLRFCCAVRGAVHTAVAADVGSFDRVVLTVDDDIDVAEAPVNVTFSTRELKVSIYTY